ncbi:MULTISPECIES: 1,4-dihydroxy-2-naphthoate polyprenyltransferase [Ferrimonas]|uniref:1,4-dihydroxy-2-naphthoate polyprenyltransferase n=1 Tax=Ferrimonas TaxID=44011 RepID=UPI0004165359|nr:MULTISPECIES: 1,4-dihydroxy-2-naphthoate polyprenyltransferase [Ferrimonas]USD36735.1 1,4-dihydroxy-2-naphthoate polyprenyltransferase [Ferrimonas sp. SCSIO 43195]
MNLQYWILAIRPRTLPAAIGPLLVGNVLAVYHQDFSWLVAIASMACAVLLQIGVNLANDYFDFKSGVDTDERLGPTRVTQQGLLSATSVRNGMILSLTLATLIGQYLIFVGGWPIAGLALFALAGALCYSGGPYPLASHGLGEIAAYIYFGLVAVVGSYFIQTGTTDSSAWLLASAVGLLNAAIMLVNNTRDRSTDIKAGKRTLAVRLGLERSQLLYQMLIASPYLMVTLGWLMGLLPGATVAACAISIPMAKALATEFAHTQGAALNPLLGRTAKLTMFFSGLASGGLLMAL